MSEAMMTITMASFGLVALSILLFAGLKGWQGWLEVKRMELAGPARREPRSPTARPDRDGGPQGTDPQARIDRRLHRPLGPLPLPLRGGGFFLQGKDAAMFENPVARRTAIAAGIGALIAIPVPFVGPLFGLVVGAGYGFFTARPNG